MKTNAQMGLIANVLVGVTGSMQGFRLAAVLGFAAVGCLARFAVAVGGAALPSFILGTPGFIEKRRSGTLAQTASPVY